MRWRHARQIAERILPAPALHAGGVCKKITLGQASYFLDFDQVMVDNLLSPSMLLAGRDYDGGSIRANLNPRRRLPVIPMREFREARICADRQLYHLRNLTERHLLHNMANLLESVL